MKECSELAANNMQAFNAYITKLYAAYEQDFLDGSEFIKAKLDAYKIQQVQA